MHYVILRAFILYYINKTMIQNLKNMLKMVYFSDLQPQSIDTKHFKKRRPSRLNHFSINNNTNTNSNGNSNKLDANIKQICTLIHSEQRCENWILQLQSVKQNYIVKQELYNAIKNCTVNVHNLFLMMIQCRVLSDQVWVCIDQLCKLEGDRDQQMCCIIHFTVMNLGKKYREIHNPVHWSNQKAQAQLGYNFQKIYNSQSLTLHQKITILPMLIVLNSKNSQILHQKLPWLYNFPSLIITNLRNNMTRLTEERVSSMLSNLTITNNNDYFMGKMCIKSIQLLQEKYSVEGFVSVKNLFAFGYQLYNIGLLLEFLAACAGFVQEKQSMFRLQLIQFLTDLMDCINLYEFDFDYGKNTKDVTNLRQIIINNKLYLQQLNQIKFNQQLQGLNKKLQEVKREQLESNIREKIFMRKVQSATKSLQLWFMQNLQANKKQAASSLSTSQSSTNVSLARVIPRLSSEDWLHNDGHHYSDQNSTISRLQSNNNNSNQSDQQQQQQSILTPLNPQQKLTRFCNQRHQTILSQLLCQLYQLKSDYLHIIYCIMYDCYLREQQPYSQINSSFYKLQLYLSKKYLLEFLVYNYNSLQTKNNALAMISYYKILGLLIKSNPINYGKLDRIIIGIQEEMGKQNCISTNNNNSKYNSNNGNSTKYNSNSGKTKSNITKSFTQTFTRNISLSKTTILMILSDQFEWKQNQNQKYANQTYQSYFVSKIINQKRMELMVGIVQNVCQIENAEYREIRENKDKEGVGKSQTILNKKREINKNSGQYDNEQFEKKNQKYQWITLLLTLYYYFQQIMQPSPKPKKQQIPQLQPQKHRINTPNKLFFDKIVQQQKLMQKLYPILHINQKTGEKQKILTTILTILDDWQQFYLSNSKKSIMQYNLSFPVLRIYKKKIKARIAGFVKTKEYQENGEEFYQKYVHVKRNSTNNNKKGESV